MREDSDGKKRRGDRGKRLEEELRANLTRRKELAKARTTRLAEAQRKARHGEGGAPPDPGEGNPDETV